MAIAKLIIKDEVNVKIEGVSPECRRKLMAALSFFVPGARYLPAVKLGRWDGKISFCDLAGRTYLNLLDRLLPIIQKSGYTIDIEDNRVSSVDFNFTHVDENSYSHLKWPAGHQLAGQPIVIKQHQVDIINLYLENIQSINIVPTGGGKTIITGILSHKIQEYGRSIIIVPSKDLVTQTEQDYINMGLDVGVFFGDRKEIGKTHTICTWQSLENVNKGNYDITIEEFLDNVVCVICDETHRVKGNILRSLLGGAFRNIPIRWGLTGTMPEEDMDKFAVISCLGALVGEIKTSDLQDQGILAKLHINVLQTNDPMVSYGQYQVELKWLLSNLQRMKYVANSISKVSDSGNTLVLVDRIEAGEMLEQLIPDSVFLSGKTKSSVRKEEYTSVRDVDNKVIIATYGISSTGINIPRIFNLVLIEPGKGFVKVIQSIGRGLRVTKDKDFVNVYDICSNAKYSKRHLTKRKQFYKERGYEFTVSKVDY